MSRSWKMVSIGEVELPEYQVEFLRERGVIFTRMPGLRPNPEGAEVEVTPATLISGMIEAWIALSTQGALKEPAVPAHKGSGRKTRPKENA